MVLCKHSSFVYCLRRAGSHPLRGRDQLASPADALRYRRSGRVVQTRDQDTRREPRSREETHCKALLSPELGFINLICFVGA